MDEKKIAKYLLISLVSMLAIAWVLTLSSMNHSVSENFPQAKETACFKA